MSVSRLFNGFNWDLVTLSTAIFRVLYSFAGYENVNNVLDEIKDPLRTLKTIAPTTFLTIAIFYSMVNVAYSIVVPLDEIKNSEELTAGLLFERIFGPHIGGTMLPVLIALSAADTVMVMIPPM
ncbi:MAG: hypothetical protein M1836_000793 [Candelina mexicana]|nr:MAG: hypothetical protein M1836_000793 [Candelina mexicana]